MTRIQRFRRAAALVVAAASAASGAACAGVQSSRRLRGARHPRPRPLGRQPPGTGARMAIRHDPVDVVTIGAGLMMQDLAQETWTWRPNARLPSLPMRQYGALADSALARRAWFHGADVRYTRLALEIPGPEAFGRWTTSAMVEADFFGDFAPGSAAREQPIPRLRLAYAHPLGAGRRATQRRPCELGVVVHLPARLRLDGHPQLALPGRVRAARAGCVASRKPPRCRTSRRGSTWRAPPVPTRSGAPTSWGTTTART